MVHKFQIVTLCDRHKCHKWSHVECDWYKPRFYFCLESGSERTPITLIIGVPSEVPT